MEIPLTNKQQRQYGEYTPAMKNITMQLMGTLNSAIRGISHYPRDKIHQNLLSHGNPGDK